MRLFGIWMALILALAPRLAQSAVGDDDSDYVGYDSIVDDLQKQNSKIPDSARSSTRKGWMSSNSSSEDPFENVWIHAGVGFAQSTQNITLPNGVGAYVAGRGVQAAFGIDILGPSFSAEGAVRSFSETEGSTTKVSLKEFDLKVLYKARRSNVGIRAGGGLSARYMSARSGLDVFEMTTPASVVTVGGDIYLTSSISLGIDLATRNAMINDTFDKTSYDGTVRLDTHF